MQIEASARTGWLSYRSGIMYIKSTWIDGELLDADKMNHIESGIYNNSVTQTTVDGNVASFKNADGVTLFTLNIGG